MKYQDAIKFRKDLLFNGAVQVGWLESDPQMAENVSRHYVFHGPDYHGVAEADFERTAYQLVDTASFVLDLVERLRGKTADDPFTIAIAGYGTGKSHLSVTLSTLLSNPGSKVGQDILANIRLADAKIADKIQNELNEEALPYLVVTINGMQDFDLSAEITRQVLRVLHKKGLDTSALDLLQPRFKAALHFTESFFETLKDDFIEKFGKGIEKESIVEGLEYHDEDVFRKVSEVYELKMGTPIRATGYESLHDIIRITKEAYCGPGKPFASLLIIFDEFGRYLEFSVQKPHVAGSGALQQLFECIQANGDKVFLLCFIQYELKAYISRIAPELRDDLNRYVTRYDSVRKVRLSTNLETLIANLFEKRDTSIIEEQVPLAGKTGESILGKLKSWFPDLNNHAVWVDQKRYENVICKGCWPLHPISTWIFVKLSAIGKSLQQRSALSLLAEIYQEIELQEIADGELINPVDLCNESLINEFLSTEAFGAQRAYASEYEEAIRSYQHELNSNDIKILKAILLSSKIGAKIENKQDYISLLSEYTGLPIGSINSITSNLELELGILEWNELLHQYQIVSNAVPRRQFLSYIAAKAAEIDSSKRAEIFSMNYAKWFEKEVFDTDFGMSKNSTTKEWNYRIHYTDVSGLETKTKIAFDNWFEARGVDEEKGQLIYCYVGPESNINSVRLSATEILKRLVSEKQVNREFGAPVAILLLYDVDGSFGKSIAEYWVLCNKLNEEEMQKYGHYVQDRIKELMQVLMQQFENLGLSRDICFATDCHIEKTRLAKMLERLFEVVYPYCPPFPFDGFSTSRGNAASDCQTFTRDLFTGFLDKERIFSLKAKQINRANEVLVKTWQVFEDDGSLRLKPLNKLIRNAVELIEEHLNAAEDANGQKRLNLGTMIRILCAPPFGYNIASAGLVLGIFYGRRKNILHITFGEEIISVENWLQKSMPGNFLDMAVLNCTEFLLISEKSVSEWEELLDDWDAEKKYIRIVEFDKRATELQKRVPLPKNLCYKFELLSGKCASAEKQLVEHENTLNSALIKINNGKEKDNASLAAWGAANLIYQRNQMALSECWTQEQITELDRYIDEAHVFVKQRFKYWLPKQTIGHYNQFEKFEISMKKMGNSLQLLGLIDEKKQLEKHVQEVDANIRFLTDVREVSSNIDKLVNNSMLTNIPLVTINSYLEQVKDLRKLLEEARKKSEITKLEIDKAEAKLKQFENDCKDYISKCRDRMEAIYEVEEFKSLGEIELLRKEAAALAQIYLGQEQDVEDLTLVLKQLDLCETHFKLLDDGTLSEDEFENTFNYCLQEMDQAFSDDDPPLDTEIIYNNIKKQVIEKRRNRASQWIKKYIDDIEDISTMDARRTSEVIKVLENAPPVLSLEEKKTVHDLLSICESHLDELDIDGLLERFRALKDDNKKLFLVKAARIIGFENIMKELSKG